MTQKQASPHNHIRKASHQVQLVKNLLMNLRKNLSRKNRRFNLFDKTSSGCVPDIKAHSISSLKRCMLIIQPLTDLTSQSKQ